MLLWALTLNATIAGRGLFWDGSSFLVNILDLGEIHDFYAARAHVDWVTQVPVLLLAKAGVRDTRLLAIVYSATLFGLPTALYHLALARVRDDGVLLGIVIAVIAVVYLPTCFFIVGEYNVAYAVVVLAMAVVLVGRQHGLGDAVLLCLLGVLAVRSYEAMVYLGPLVAAAIAWSLSRGDFREARGLVVIAAVGFIAGAFVALATIADYWSHPHFIKVRSTSMEFWQNLQFAVPLVALAICAAIGLLRPSWLRGRGPAAVIGLAMVAVVSSPWWRVLDPDSILYPPSHYLARQAAGLLLLALLGCMWLHVAWQQRPPKILVVLREPNMSRCLALTMTALMLAAAVPDVALTGLWSDYLARVRALVDGRQGIIRAADLPLLDWPDKLFAQDWSLPATSAIVSRTPGRAYILIDKDYRTNPPFDPACGTLPRLQGYHWGG